MFKVKHSFIYMILEIY